MEQIWRCPICGQLLREEEGVARCPQGHSFDRARSGYFNLLPPENKHSRQPGDNKEMVAARWAFLQKGHYAPLARLACAMALERENKPCRVLDAGCGEGYYGKILWQSAKEAGVPLELAGVDISKFAVDKGAKQLREGRFAVGSLYHLPLKDEAAGGILNFFAPHCPAEFARVLAEGGWLLVAVPGPRHLWELKEFLYENPYENPQEALPMDGFSLLCRKVLTYSMELEQDDLWSLFQMTPYYYKTDPAQRDRLRQMEGLSVTADFELLLYEKE